MAGLMATFLIVALTLTLTISIAMVTAASSTVQFVFGDSLTDVGNNNFLRYSLAKSNYPWYGVDYINGQPTGRFTNGRTIGDIICKSGDIICNSTIKSLH